MGNSDTANSDSANGDFDKLIDWKQYPKPYRRTVSHRRKSKERTIALRQARKRKYGR